MNYQLITDATADLTQEMLQSLPEITIIPMEVVINDCIFNYGPQGNLSIHSFYDALRQNSYAMTAQPNPAIYRSYFESILQKGKDLIYLCFTSGLSNMYSNAKKCLQQLQSEYPDRRIYCVDTKCASIGEGFFVREALLRQQEGYSAEALIRWMNNFEPMICQWFTLSGFNHLKRGGRVSIPTAAIGNILKIKPLLHVSQEGKLEIVDPSIRGTNRAISVLSNRMEAGWQPSLCSQVLIGHGDCPEVAEKLAQKIQAQFPDANLSMAPIGPIIGAHTGPDILALVYCGTTR